MISVPFWFIPPLVLIVPPLIWGWLTYRVMGFDVLAEHASVAERQALLREHRWPMLWMGTIAGYLGAAPSLIWAFGALTVLFAPLLAVVAVWLYTLVFAFSALWFAHYGLAALQALAGPSITRHAGRLTAGAARAASLPPSAFSTPVRCSEFPATMNLRLLIVGDESCPANAKTSTCPR